MQRLNYADRTIFDQALKLIDRREAIDIVVVGWRANVIAKAFPNYLNIISSGRSNFDSRLSIVKLVLRGAYCAQPSG